MARAATKQRVKSTRVVGTKKAETHDRIVREAAKALRRDGYSGTSVADVMHAAGLTHGGFYAHFPSREAMLAEGLDLAAAETAEALLGAAARRAATDDLDLFTALVDNYLSDRHVAATETGCTIAALGSETRRQSPEIRSVATRRTEELVKMIERHAGGREEALAALSTMVGALVIARIVDDPALSAEVRDAAKRAVLKS
jgi:AcrR family transcriptional regulator